MHEVTSQHPNSPDTPKADDERSPLLPKCTASCVQKYTTTDELSPQAISDEISTAKLRWIMTSVWIGTFCAGLGMPWSFACLTLRAQREQLLYCGSESC